MTFQFKIQLTGITHPPVWRRLLVPGQFTFLRMHRLIQTAFGWRDYHLFQFSPSGYSSRPAIGIPDPDMDDDVIHAKEVKLRDIFTATGQKFTYIYDFGDDWFHQLVLEAIIPEKRLRADCIDGKGICPPEDCGGPPGYENLKKILAHPKHPEHKEMKDWLGLARNETWDPDIFDLETTKQLVAKI